MKNVRSIRALLIHLLLIISIVLPYMAMPAKAAASTISPDASLVQGRNETVDAYLKRVATADPQLFQQASLAAVQDAFNGRLPEAMGDQAMESQIAHYLHLAATGSPMNDATSGVSSAVNGDAYLWNSTQADQTSKSSSSWQLTARPGGDPKAFAQTMDHVLNAPAKTQMQRAPEPDASTTALLIGPPQSTEAMEIVSPADDRSSMPQVNDSSIVAPAPVAAEVPVVMPLVPSYDELFEQTAAAHLEQASVQSSSNPMVVAPAKARTADLGIKVSAPVTVTYGDVITYTVTVTNNGPATASDVQMTQALPANGVFDSEVDTCKKSEEDDDAVVCAIGVLSATKRMTLRIPITMEGSDVVTSTFTIKDLGGTVDPNGKNSSRSVSTTIIAPTVKRAPSVMS